MSSIEDRGGMTLEQIAQIFGVSRERIRQIEKKALKKLRVALEQEGMSFADLVPAMRGERGCAESGEDE
jgi:DNA-directed RNA polymerase sigma subunit (sigma70/sigma32)